MSTEGTSPSFTERIKYRWDILRRLANTNPREFLKGLAGGYLGAEKSDESTGISTVGEEQDNSKTTRIAEGSVNQVSEEPVQEPKPKHLDSTETVDEPEESRALEPGESFDGNMPILDHEATNQFYKVATGYYGEVMGNGKWSIVTKQGGSVFKFYKDPDNILNAYDVVFQRRFGGKVAGLPEFQGVVPNGYKMEVIEGDTLNAMYNSIKKNAKTEEEFVEALREILSPDQAQDLLNKIAAYHKVTGRVHGDLATTKGYDNIMVSPEGEVRIIDTEWERVGDQTPQSELQGIYELLTNNFGIEGLELPQTISADDAAKNLAAFKKEVREMVEVDNVFTNRVLRFKSGAPQVIINENGQVLVNDMKKTI